MRGRKILDLTGRRFGRLVALEPLPRRKDNGGVRWLCRCDCDGNLSDHSRDDLRSGGSQSCGCLKREQMQKRMRTHGLSKTPEYKIWAGMIRRCTKPEDANYKYYGGRGIRVAKVWRESFAAFFAELGPRPEGTQIERIDNDLGYRPGNCKWASPVEQRRNQTKRMVCARGHLLSDDNVYLRPGTRHRCCRECRRLAKKARRVQSLTPMVI